MVYEEFRTTVKSLGFEKLEDFAKYIGVTSNAIIHWQEQDEIPYMVALIVHLLKGETSTPPNAILDGVLEECLPLAELLHEASSFPKKLEEMFDLQKRLNENTNGKNWELGINKFDKEINWLRCIHMEAAELVDSTPWKHWKNIKSDPDINNIHIELIDIWHFLMSYILQETNIPKAVALVNTHCIYEPSASVDSKLLVKETEKLSYVALAIQTGNIPSFGGIERLIDQFFRCCKIAGLSFGWLQKVYIGKNCLNQFRQDHGYKEGIYKKTWGKKEDNEAMMEILEKSETITFDELYEALEKKYQEN
jgi:dimeric dUTPase (all-alpha-NTP-PPase superfamily)